MGRAIGSLLALYLFIGRWTFARLQGSYEMVAPMQQPRVWILAAAVVCVVVVWCRPSNSERQRWRWGRVDLGILLFFGFMLATFFWAPDAELANAKVFELLLLVVASAVICLARYAGLIDQVSTGFWYALLAIGVTLGLITLALSTGGRTFVPSGGPNTFGRNMGLMAIAALFLASRPSATPIAKMLSVGVTAMGVMLVLMCGSRGGFFSSVAAGLTFFVVSQTYAIKKVFALGVLVIGGCGVLFFTSAGSSAIAVFQHRIVDQTIGQRYMAGRDDLWSQAWELGVERPWLGWGLNGFQANSWTYPHNILLEIWVEAGLVGLTVFLFVLFTWGQHYWRYRHAVPRATVAALALTFVAAQSSGDLYDSRGVFLMLSLAAPTVLRFAPTVAKSKTPQAAPLPVLQPTANTQLA